MPRGAVRSGTMAQSTAAADAIGIALPPFRATPAWRSRVSARDPLDRGLRHRRADAGEAGKVAPPAAETAAPTDAFLRGQDFIRRCIAGDPATRDEFVSQYGALVRYAIASVLRS